MYPSPLDQEYDHNVHSGSYCPVSIRGVKSRTGRDREVC